MSYETLLDFPRGFTWSFQFQRFFFSQSSMLQRKTLFCHLACLHCEMVLNKRKDRKAALEVLNY